MTSHFPAGVQTLNSVQRSLAGRLHSSTLCTSGQLLHVYLCVSGMHESAVSCMGSYEEVGAPQSSHCLAGKCLPVSPAPPCSLQQVQALRCIASHAPRPMHKPALTNLFHSLHCITAAGIVEDLGSNPVAACLLPLCCHQ